MNEVENRYDGVAIFLHWVIAIGVVLLVFAELIRHEWPKGTFMRDGLKALHNPVGTVFFAVIIVRVMWWIFVARTIESATAIPRLEAILARLVKLGLYAMMVAIPVTGIVYVFARGRVIDFAVFDIASPVTLSMTRGQAGIFKDAHAFLAWAVLALAAVHAFAALWHHHVRHDDVLRRMLPGALRRR